MDVLYSATYPVVGSHFDTETEQFKDHPTYGYRKKYKLTLKIVRIWKLNGRTNLKQRPKNLKVGITLINLK